MNWVCHKHPDPNPHTTALGKMILPRWMHFRAALGTHSPLTTLVTADVAGTMTLFQPVSSSSILYFLSCSDCNSSIWVNSIFGINDVQTRGEVNFSLLIKFINYNFFNYSTGHSGSFTIKHHQSDTPLSALEFGAGIMS